MKTIEVEAVLGERYQMQSTVRSHKLVVDQPTAAGGLDAGPTPLEYLALALAGCIGAIGRVVASQQRLPVRGMRIKVSGGLDPNGYLGKATDHRVGFTGFTVEVAIEGDLSREQQEQFVHEVDRRCPVSENLQHPTPVSVRLA
jgi:uncharacterized OsmC-like protein